MVLPTDPDDPTSGVRSTALATQYRRRFLPVRPVARASARAGLLAQRAPSLRSLRFQGNGTASDDEDHDHDADNPNRAIGEWRTRDRVKTVSVLISLCMNIGIAPPDAPKPAQAAKLQAWLDPFSQAPNKALDAIAKALQAQYEVWQPRARYRLSTDPTLEDLKKQCCSLRKGAKEERILFHYNGHGVPRPTPSGELWVFNKGYTQYIPVSIYDLQTWLGAPCIFVYECSAAGNILLSFNQFAAQRDAEVRQHLESLAAQHQQQLAASPPPSTADGAASAAAPAGTAAPTSAPPSIHGSVAAPSLPPPPPVTFPAFSDCIQLAACGPNETLPWNPDLPADVFTACLTTPIQMALRWFLLQNAHARKHVTADMVARLPGRLNDRRTPLGELNWIFTAVTDTIAWSVLPRDMFRRLFRQDLMVAALFRNYLLAHRVMKAYGCHPMTTPALPGDTDMHPMWAAWDMVVDLCIDQLPAMLAAERAGVPFDYVNATFFAEQLTAFEVWLNQGALTTRPPLQLPIVLQVLLSQYHRHRALIILSKFLDLGPWAVGEALQVGIFPYVLKLLQSPAPELKPVLVFIWTRILAVDPGCQQDLMKDNVFTYFLHVLSPTAHMATSQDVSEHRAMCAFVLSTLCHGYPTGQLACLQNSVLPLCLLYLQDHDDLLRQWSCICIAQVCHQNPEAILAAYHEGAHVKIAQSLADTVVEVRAAAVLALGTFLQLSSPQLQALAVEIVKALLPCMADPAAMVRAEVVIALSCFVTHHRPRLEAAVDRLLAARAAEAKAAAAAAAAGAGGPTNANARAVNGTNARGASRLAALVSVPTADPLEALTSAVLKLLLVASVDPDEHVAMLARGMVDAMVAKSDLFPPSSTLFEQLRKYFARPQIRPAECRLPGSVRDLERRWTFERNRAQFLGSREAYPTVPRGTTWTQAAYISHPDGPVRAFRFHAFEDMLVSASSTHLSAWAVHTDKSDLGSTVTEPTGQAVWRLENNSPAAAITALDLINEDGYSLLGVGTNDGVVRLWRDVVPYRSAYSDFRPPPTVAASWRALPDLIKPKSAGTSSGVVLKWISALSSLAVAGDARTVKVWDLERATCLRDVHTQSAMPVAAVTCDVLRAPHVLVIGNGDGAVRVLDMRAGPTQAVVMTLREHRAWVVGVDVQQGSPWDTDNPGAVGTAGAGGLGLHIVSASAHGDVKCWDLRRGARSVRSIDAYANASLATLAVHPYVPLAAAGSAAGQVKLLDVALEPAVGEDPVRATITHYDGFLGQRLGKVTATAFHPLVPTLAVGAGGTGAVQGGAGAVVSVYRATGG